MVGIIKISKVALPSTAVITISLFASISSANAQSQVQSANYPGTAFQVRKSTMAAKLSNPNIGRQSTTLAKSNPYEQRIVDINQQQYEYDIALRKYEAKMAAKEMKEKAKQEKAEQKRISELKKAKERAKRAALHADQKASKFSLPFISSSKPTHTIKSSTEAEREEAAYTQVPESQQVTSAKVSAPIPRDVSVEDEEPGFFQKLKWAIFGQ